MLPLLPIPHQMLPESVLDGFPCPIIKIDRNFRLLYHNPAARALHGPAPEKTPPPHCYEWLKLSQRCPQCPVEQAFQNGQPATNQKCSVTSDHRLIRVEQTAIPVFDACGDVEYVLEIDLDTTPLMTLQWDYEVDFVQTMFAFAELIEKRDIYTGRHSEKTRDVALKLGRALELDTTQLDDLSTISLLHDIGKVGIPETILLKKGPLTSEERQQIETHAQLGHDVLCKINRFQQIANSILCHHEWFNGQGYPNGIKGEEIPWLARILSVADVFEALTADRVYRSALPRAKALAIIRDGSGSQFDPQVVDALLQLNAESA